MPRYVIFTCMGNGNANLSENSMLLFVPNICGVKKKNFAPTLESWKYLQIFILSGIKFYNVLVSWWYLSSSFGLSCMLSAFFVIRSHILQICFFFQINVLSFTMVDQFIQQDLFGVDGKMRGTNPAWLIPISDDLDVALASLSGKLIRKRLPAERIVAFVADCVKTSRLRELQTIFDQVIVAPETPNWRNLEKRENILLLQSLTLTSFTTLVVVRAGVLIFWSFDEVLKSVKFSVGKNQPREWTVGVVVPNPGRYMEALELFQDGRPFDINVLMDKGRNVSNDGDCVTSFSWSNLKYYDGLEPPFVQLDTKTLIALEKRSANTGPTDEPFELSGFWQKTLFPKLVSLFNSNPIERRAPLGWKDEHQKSWIAIVGMSCRFPNANSIDEYWKVLSSGESTVCSPPSNRIGKCELASDVRASFLKASIDEFDTTFFEIPPNVTIMTDPQARLLLEVSWEAFEDGGINPEKLRGAPVAVFYGSFMQDYNNLLGKEDISPSKSYNTNGFGCTAGKLSFFYGFTGRNIATESGCSSSMVAVQLACETLRNGECPLALAAGANVILQMNEHSSQVFWAKDGLCKSFDSKGNGYGRGEGIGVLLLKRYADAVRDSDNIHGIILGSASSQEGLSSSFGSPTIENEWRTMRNALGNAGVSPTDVDYVECHATGTAVGDPIEAEAIVNAYSCQRQERQVPLLVGSVKTNIGHTEACSGIASIIKVLLAMKNESIPPHINVESINPKVDFSRIPAKITLESEEWKRSTRPRIAGISNFGITGTDVHIIIQEPPKLPESTYDKPPLHILTLSAKTSEALDMRSEALMKVLEKGSDDNLADIAYTLNACRFHHHEYRRAIVGANREELILQLKEQKTHVKESKMMLKLCFVCDDILSDKDFEQYLALYSHFPAFQISMDTCDTVCKELTGFSPMDYLQNKIKLLSFDEKEWKRVNRQFCSFSVSYSLFKLWDSWDVKGTTLLGINFGEVVGAAITGELELDQCFRLIQGEEILVKNQDGIPSKKRIKYFSASTEEEKLNVEHLKKMCNKEKTCSNQMNPVLARVTSKFGCNAFIQVGLERNPELKINGMTPYIATPTADSIPSTGELINLYSALANLYLSGYPINWEGFYYGRTYRKVSLPHYPFQRKSFWYKRGKGDTKLENENPIPPMLNMKELQLHPLLGSYVPSLFSGNESDSSNFPSHIFENLLVVQQQAPYLSDHIIGSELIFPGAAHLELLLAANHLQGGDGERGMPCTVENFQIHLPLQLFPSEGKKLRTLMTQQDPAGDAGLSKSSIWNTIVQAQMEGGAECNSTLWNTLASGAVSITQQDPGPQFKIEEIKNRCSTQNFEPYESYKKLEKLGLKFGQQFQSIKCLYQCESSGECITQVGIPEGAVHYVCHPLLSDTMIQCYLFHTQKTLTTIHVPVGIRRLICHRRLTPQECSCANLVLHIYYSGKENIISLLDSKGNAIVTMVEPFLKATTVSSILTAAGISKSNEKEVPIWEVVWKPATKYQTDGSLKLCNDAAMDFTKSPNYALLMGSIEKRNRFSIEEKRQRRLLGRLCELYIYKAFHELGWEPKVGESFKVSELEAQFQIAPNFRLAFRHYLTYIERIGGIEISGETIRIKVLPPNQKQVEDCIAQLVEDLEGYRSLPSVVAASSKLALIWQAKVKGQSILFKQQEEDGLTLADFVYQDTFYRNLTKDTANVFFEVARHLWERNGDEKCDSFRKLRILEVGAGTGSFTQGALMLLDEEGIEYSYFFADISSQFLKKAEARFPNVNVVYKMLDIEKEPLSQGFPPAYFDIVVGLDVVYATKNVRKSIRHLQNLVKEGGHIIFGESNKPMPEADMTFGILDGYWHFEDFDIRPTHCTIPAEKWLGLLKESGFHGPSSKVLLAESNFCIVVGTLSHSHPHFHQDVQLIDTSHDARKTWLLLHDPGENQEWVAAISRRMSDLDRVLISHSVSNYLEGDALSISRFLNENIGKNVEGILCLFEGAESSASSNCRELLEPLLLASKYLVENGKSASWPKLCVATSGLWKECEALATPNPATTWGFIRCLRMEIPWIVTKLVDLELDIELEMRVNALVQELWMGDDETEVVYRGGIRYTRSMVKVQPTKNLLDIPADVKDYTLQLSKSNLLTDLLYVPKPTNELGPSQVMVEVRAVSLNFKDVLVAMNAKNSMNEKYVGIDFSGVIKSVGTNVSELTIGSPVFGVCFNESTFSRYINVPVEQVALIPPSLTFTEAAAVPGTALTALKCLIHIANASPGQTILIHAASGGVGIFAIQIAKYLGLKIVATAGSPRKRKFLTHRLGVQHVFNSRTLEFGEKIKEITNGQGVDIVLNCLTGPGFKETSLEICKIGGHFVEISKLDIWKVDEVKNRKPGVNYTTFDLTKEKPTVFAMLFKTLSKYLDNGLISLPPRTRFTASTIINALQFLQKAKHVGKVVVEMPVFDSEMGVWKENLFNDRSSYLITGGKGAIGLAIAEWMVSHGAKHVVLLGRSPPKEKALEIIHKLEEEDRANILCVEADVTDFHQMKKVFEDIQCDPNLPPLRGIHHCAGVLSDRMIGAEDWNNFDYVLNPKVKGAYNLHKLTLQTPLEFFVVHSSISCTIGNPGQSNYVAGNLYMEALIESRLSMGLQGMSISWGHWNAGLAENMQLELMDAFSIQQGILVLERFFKENCSSGGVGHLNVLKICKVFSPYEKTFMENLVRQTGGVELESDDEGTPKENLTEVYKKTGDEQRFEIVMEFIRNKVGETLGVDPQEVSNDVNFSRMGLDSLLSIEFYNKLQSSMGHIDLGYIDMEESGTVTQMAAILKTTLDKTLF